MNIRAMRIGAFAALLAWAAFVPVHAQEAIDDSADSEQASRLGNGGFLELGATGKLESSIRRRSLTNNSGELTSELDLAISGGYRYNNWFFEVSESPFAGLNLGKTLAGNNQWNLDLLFANIAGQINLEDDDSHPSPQSEEARNQQLLNRDTLYVAAGVRATLFSGNSLFQFRLVSDWLGSSGLLGSLRFGHQWQLGNWNVQAIAGARHYSDKFNNYLYGVTESEQTALFPKYEAGVAWIPELELGASKPVSQDWVYSMRLRWRTYPDSITNSPLVSEDSDMLLSAGFHFVF